MLAGGGQRGQGESQALETHGGRELCEAATEAAEQPFCSVCARGEGGGSCPMTHVHADVVSTNTKNDAYQEARCKHSEWRAGGRTGRAVRCPQDRRPERRAAHRGLALARHRQLQRGQQPTAAVRQQEDRPDRYRTLAEYRVRHAGGHAGGGG